MVTGNAGNRYPENICFPGVGGDILRNHEKNDTAVKTVGTTGEVE